MWRGNSVQDISADRHQCFFVKSYPDSAWRFRWAPNVSHHHTNTAHPTLVIPSNPVPPNYFTGLNLFWQLFFTSSHYRLACGFPSSLSKVHKPQTSSGWPWNGLYFLLSSSKPGSSGSWPWYTALLGLSKTSTGSFQPEIPLKDPGNSRPGTALACIRAPLKRPASDHTRALPK